jgi:RNA exonuclease 4
MSSSEGEATAPVELKKRTRDRRQRRTNCKPKKLLQSNDKIAWSANCGSVSSSDESNRIRWRPRRSGKKLKEAYHWQWLQHVYCAQFLALDCEMVGVGEGGTRSALARVTIVNWNEETIYDRLVRPTEPVTDYRTFVSGITKDDLSDERNHGTATTRPALIDLKTCRAQVLQLIQDKILIGHALENDLTALQIEHPWQWIRDTAQYEPFMKQRAHTNSTDSNGTLWPRKLKDLSWHHLQSKIQRPGQPHSAWEDAVAALRLYKHVQVAWEKVMDYKIRQAAVMESARTERNSLGAIATAVPPVLVPIKAIQA